MDVLLLALGVLAVGLLAGTLAAIMALYSKLE